ncbi:EAL domain-containing protein [Idiomarina sp. UBA3162]|uniref:EAL domain-containing response regulator n=1 Tax=unclassified Idiomarina TaxID=2614829 RepID=UPI000C975C33|nr:EAL domain-containing response regulator [Idiomarina sp. UBA3162]MAD53181.1 hypothetical protein [Idiomarinaceae bacterium]MEC7642242.1 EAL domain-containing response regulator [Pseudomonadota bacterium]|tara:strand:- start:2368 stop:3597 length:1230 start_codon:yes stop_codon:yes gene_type:complete
MNSNYEHVLILEDDAVTAAHLSSTLSKHGITTVTRFESGFDVLHEVEHNKHPDLILCDLRLSDMDGLQFVRFLTETHYEGDIGFISGNDSRVLDVVQQLARSLGYSVLGGITKPVTPNQVVRLLMARPINEPEQQPHSIYSLTANQIIKGVRTGALLPYYQPKVDIIDNRVIGFESLARWRDRKTDQILSPATFIPVAERFGIISELSLTFLKAVLSDFKHFDAFDEQVTVAVNFSIDSLSDRHLPDMLLDLLREYNVSPSRIVIEVTESRLANERINVLEVLARLHLAGFRLSIDDFGTGYSSLYRLKHTPFEELKLDRSFVQDAVRDNSAKAVIRSSMQLAKELNMQVVAEGVETEAEQQLVNEMGCGVMQGFRFAKPQPIERAFNVEWPLHQVSQVESHLTGDARV